MEFQITIKNKIIDYDEFYKIIKICEELYNLYQEHIHAHVITNKNCIIKVPEGEIKSHADFRITMSCDPTL